jgi:ABC-type transporter Mla subunit MlaD
MPASTGNLQTAPKSPRRPRPWIAISVVIVLPVIGLTVVSRLAQNGPRMTISTCLEDAMFLREGAPVLLTGTQIGYVAATTQDRTCPAKATLVLTDPEVTIPSDSIVSLTLSKVTGETEMVIDRSRAFGPKIENGGVLRSTPQR